MRALASGKSPLERRTKLTRIFVFYKRDGTLCCTSIEASTKKEALNRALALGGVEDIQQDWTINKDAVNTVKGLLKLRWPVRIQRIFGLNSRGIHKLRLKPGAASPHHTISVNREEGAKAGNRALWHELGHAEHSEEVGSLCSDPHAAFLAWKHACAEWAKLPYEERPQEVKATAYEECAQYLSMTKEA